MSTPLWIRPGARAVTAPTLTMSVDLPRSVDEGCEPHRVCVSVRLPKLPSPEEVRLVERRLHHLACSPTIDWRRWEWGPAGEGDQVVTVRGRGLRTGGPAVRDTLTWLRSLSKGEPGVTVISPPGLVPVHRSRSVPPGAGDGEWDRSPGGLWVARTVRRDGPRVVLVRRE